MWFSLCATSDHDVLFHFFLSRVKVKSGTCNLNSICGCFSGKTMTQVSSNVVCNAVESLDFSGARLSRPEFLFFLGCFQLSHLSSLLTLRLFSHSWSCAQLQAYKQISKKGEESYIRTDSLISLFASLESRSLTNLVVSPFFFNPF